MQILANLFNTRAAAQIRGKAEASHPNAMSSCDLMAFLQDVAPPGDEIRAVDIVMHRLSQSGPPDSNTPSRRREKTKIA